LAASRLDSSAKKLRQGRNCTKSLKRNKHDFFLVLFLLEKLSEEHKNISIKKLTMSVFINDFNIVEKTKLFGLLPVRHFNYHLGAMSEQRSEIHPHHIRILDYTNSFLFYIFDQVSSRLFCFGFFLTQGRISPMRHRDRMLSVSISFPCDFFVFKFPFLRELFSPTHKHTHTHTTRR
jgi:hypothetical protein